MSDNLGCAAHRLDAARPETCKDRLRFWVARRILEEGDERAFAGLEEVAAAAVDDLGEGGGRGLRHR